MFWLDILEDINRNIISSPPEDTIDIPGISDNVDLFFPYKDILDADLNYAMARIMLIVEIGFLNITMQILLLEIM
jgi:hypothetical protein